MTKAIDIAHITNPVRPRPDNLHRNSPAQPRLRPAPQLSRTVPTK